MNESEPGPKELREHLNLETARIPWSALARHFAHGSVVVVAADLDLVDVAARMASDDTGSVDAWVRDGHIRRASDDDARRWSGGEPELWAVVVAPWVLVQESPARRGSA